MPVLDDEARCLLTKRSHYLRTSVGVFLTEISRQPVDVNLLGEPGKIEKFREQIDLPRRRLQQPMSQGLASNGRCRNPLVIGIEDEDAWHLVHDLRRQGLGHHNDQEKQKARKCGCDPGERVRWFR
ncbi:hypothetical protein D9M70_473960 [compost metagenome]